jgi:hypothetical protein
MAIRNTLLLCAAIVSGGGIAGMSMKDRPALAPTDASSSTSYTGAPAPM